jgi:hypothetical protein
LLCIAAASNVLVEQRNGYVRCPACTHSTVRRPVKCPFSGSGGRYTAHGATACENGVLQRASGSVDVRSNAAPSLQVTLPCQSTEAMHRSHRIATVSISIKVLEPDVKTANTPCGCATTKRTGHESASDLTCLKFQEVRLWSVRSKWRCLQVYERQAQGVK